MGGGWQRTQERGAHLRPVIADSGNIGGNLSHEFHVLAESGEDQIVFNSEGDYAANIELAEGSPSFTGPEESPVTSEIIQTGDAHSIEAVASLLNVPASKMIKTLLVHGIKSEESDAVPLVALLLRGDQELNETKAAKLPELSTPLCFATDEEIENRLGCKPGNLGPLDKELLTIADLSVVSMSNFVCGANEAGKHIVNANWDNRCQFDRSADIRTIQEGDISPDGNGTLSIKRGIEVGHIFQLGKKYSEAMNAAVLDQNGRSVTMTMGCYGIGVTRVVAACIEQNHDGKGIIWPNNIAPFHLVIIPIDGHKSEIVTKTSETIWQAAEALGLDVLLDDRDKKTSTGVKFADAELIGIPHRLIVSPRSLADGVIEYKSRIDGETKLIPEDKINEFLAGL